MKKIIACLAFSMLALNSYAQEIPAQIVKSDIFKDEYKNSDIELVEDDGNGGVFIVRSYAGGVFSNGRGYYFEHYDSNLKLIKEYEYQAKQKRGEKKTVGSVIGMIMNGQEISLIEYVYEKTEKAYICSALTSNIKDFNFSSKELFRVPGEEIDRGPRVSFFGIGASRANFDNDFATRMIVNEDKSAFALTIDIKDKNSETHKIFLFDKALNKKIDHTFKRQGIKDKKFTYENIDVSKDGSTLYLLGKAQTEEAKNKKDGGRYQYELTRITNDSEKTQVFDTNEHYAASLKTIIFQDRVTCIGFYSDKKDSRFKGISYFELDPVTLAIKKSKFNPFTEQFIIDKYGKDKDKELKNISFRKLIITPQNEIILNAEEFYITTTTTFSPQGGSRTYYVYHYDDIVSAKLSTSGDIVWARNINKRQSTTSDASYISYTSTAKENDAYFFINTGEKVKKLSNDRIQFGQTSTKRSNLNVIKVNQNGEFDYKELIDDKENDVPFMVSNGAVSGNSVFFLGQKGKKKQLLKITI